MGGSCRFGVLAGALLAACAARPLTAGAKRPPGPTSAPADFGRLWEDLGSPDRARMVAATLGLLERGDSAVDFLARRLRLPGVTVDREKVARLLRDLDSDSWRVRQEAQRQLVALGPPILPLLHGALKKGVSTEAKVRIEAVLGQINPSATGSPASLRRWGATAVLGRIASARALEALVSLRQDAEGNRLAWAKAALLNLAENVLPPLLDAAGEKARAGKYAAAADLCRKALGIAEKAEHPARPRIRLVLESLQARQKGRKVPSSLPPERIGWQWVRGENLLGNGGFEAGRVTGTWPRTCGVWGGDKTEIVGRQNGIAPHSGRSMLRFHYTNYSSPGVSNGAQLLQVVDVSKFRQAIRAGRARLVASAFFNRVAGNARTDTHFSLSLMAHTGSPSQHARLREPIRRVSAGIQADGKPATWEKLSATMLLPPGTGFVAVQLMAVEDIHNDARGVEFDGHYADGAFLTVVVEPAGPVPKPRPPGRRGASAP